MKTIYAGFSCAVLMHLCCICNAQTLDLKPPPAGITIDGNSKEWGDDMRYNDAKTKINYTIVNDKENIYLVVKTNDLVQQMDIIAAGITLGIDTKGRKRTPFLVTFPVADQPDETEFMNIDPMQMQSKIAITPLRKIHAEGFKDIKEESMIVANTYGIRTAIGYDAPSGYLTYEEVIPLSLFHADDLAGKEWAFNLKINGLVKKTKVTPTFSGTRSSISSGGSVVSSSGGGGGSVVVVRSSAAGGGSSISGGGGSMMSNSTTNDAIQAAINSSGTYVLKATQLTPNIDFWGKFNLAKTP